MARIAHQREWYIPTGATKIAAKDSSAIVYLYVNSKGKNCGVAFHGKAQKPDWKYRFRNDAEQERQVREFFASIRAWEQRRANERKERGEAGRGVDVGDILRASWGYDQTNIDYFEVTALIGSKMVEVREIGAATTDGGWLQGKSVPMAGKYTGEPMRRVARNGHIKIDNVVHAYKMEPESNVAGTKVYAPSSWTAYQ